MQFCVACGAEFPMVVVTGGRLDLRGRKRCLACLPHRPLRGPRKSVHRAIKDKRCEICGRSFATRQVLDGRLRLLYRRRFCLDCSPFGVHNTSRHPSGIGEPEALREYRRRRKNQQTYRSLKQRRRRRKAELIEMFGGCCVDCGYDALPAALEFHHRDASTKEFGVGNWHGSRERLVREAEKCDLVCATCHRLRHAALDFGRSGHPVVEHRRRRKLRAVEHMGRTCYSCGRDSHPAIFEFHHRDAAEKDFGISETGRPHLWDKVLAELAKCVMLCANCHREVHAGVRELFDDGLLGLAEEPATYRHVLSA